MDVATTSDDAPLETARAARPAARRRRGRCRLRPGRQRRHLGRADQDLLEGNANGTGDAPDPAGTYGVAWPTFAGDVIHETPGRTTPAAAPAGSTAWSAASRRRIRRRALDGRKDAGDTIFGDGGGDALAGDNTVIERALEDGQWILDDLRSPDALVVRRICGSAMSRRPRISIRSRTAPRAAT